MVSGSFNLLVYIPVIVARCIWYLTRARCRNLGALWTYVVYATLLWARKDLHLSKNECCREPRRFLERALIFVSAFCSSIIDFVNPMTFSTHCCPAHHVCSISTGLQRPLVASAALHFDQNVSFETCGFAFTQSSWTPHTVFVGRVCQQLRQHALKQTSLFQKYEKRQLGPESRH